MEPYSSWGPTDDGRIKPDVNYWYDSVYTTTLGGGYTNFGGTSAATPEVAGILGIVAQMWAENVWGTDPQGATVFEKQPHASTFDIAFQLPSFAGYLMQEEITSLARVLEPERPFAAVVAGAKYDTKIGPLHEIFRKADRLVLGGVVHDLVEDHRAVRGEH